jgi:hypothetical protein
LFYDKLKLSDRERSPSFLPADANNSAKRPNMSWICATEGCELDLAALEIHEK